MVQKELSTKDFWYKSWAQAVIGGSPKTKKTGWQEACRGDGGYGGGTKALTANSSFLAPPRHCLGPSSALDSSHVFRHKFHRFRTGWILSV